MTACLVNSPGPGPKVRLGSPSFLSSVATWGWGGLSLGKELGSGEKKGSGLAGNVKMRQC